MCNHENIYTVLYGVFSVCSVFLASFITYGKHGKSVAVCAAVCQGFGPQLGFAAAKVAMVSPSALVNSCVRGVVCFPEAFLTTRVTRGKTQLMRRYFLPQGPEALLFASGVSRYN